MFGWKGARTLDHAVFIGISAISISPDIEVRAAIDDFSAKLVESGALHLVTPLRQLGAITNDVEFGIAQDVVAIIFE